ncbi:MAG TPA: cell envelope integrity protein CreD [Flavobacteriaceae bacterium]|nr:cell envelope integrity protein CreD [Flavobacteriaceae bacterium]
MKNTTPQNKLNHWIKTSITARMLMVGGLIIILLIPLGLIEELILERTHRQQDVVREINEKWGSEIVLYGPILKIPYKTYSESTKYIEENKTRVKELKTHLNYAYVFPNSLQAKIDANSKTLTRGNYQSAVFTTNMNFSGAFEVPSLVGKDIPDQDVVWEKASLVLLTSNVKGIKHEIAVKLKANSYPLEANFTSDVSPNALNTLETGTLKTEKIALDSVLPFSLDMIFNGSESIKIVPVGKNTEMEMTSNWPDPGFTGHFLPDNETKEITEKGFKAKWKVLQINRPFSQLHLNKIPSLSGFAFGTEFVVVVDELHKSERAAKYGFLVIGLTFLIFFLIQTLSKINIHPFQYLMIGLALTLFYTLLVAITEHSNFLKAYAIAGTAVVLLISTYAKSILKNLKFPVFIGLSLTALYTFIYVIIQLENYALLVGSIGLFLILAGVMFVSRKIEWNTD